MTIKPLVVLLLLIAVLDVGIVTAQDDDDAPETVTAALWERVNLEAEPDAEAVPVYVVFLASDDATTLLEVAYGADVLWTRQGDGTYSGTSLVPTDAYEFTATLEVVDADTMQAMSLLNYGNFASELHLEFRRSDFEAEVWVEARRDLTEYTLFGPCLGLESTSPPGAYANPDPIVAVWLDEDAGELVIGENVYLGGGGTFSRETLGTFGTFEQVTTETVLVSEGQLDLDFYSVAGERDDCELRFTSTYIPYDGDMAALMERAAAIGADAAEE